MFPMLPIPPMLQKFLKLHTRSIENFTHRRDDPNATAILGPLMRYWVEREQSTEWTETRLPSDIFATAHPLAQKARTLFLERIDTPKADFMAYRDASVVLAALGLLDASEDGSPRMKISPEACAAFPSLKRRENDVLRRSEALEWRPHRPGG